MVRLYRKSDVKENPDGKPIWERVNPAALGLSATARAAPAASGRVYGGATRYASRDPIHGAGQGAIHTKGNEPRGGEAGEVEVEELYQFILSDGDLYRQQFEPIVKNLDRKRAKGVYDSELSVKLWMYLVDNGAKKYLKDFGDPHARIDTVFNRQTRLSVARKLRDDYEAESTARSNYATPKIRKLNYSTPPVRKINAQEPSGKCIQSVISTLDEIDLPDTAQALRDIFGERYGAGRGNRGKKNPAYMILVNARRNPMFRSRLKRNGERADIQIYDAEARTGDAPHVRFYSHWFDPEYGEPLLDSWMQRARDDLRKLGRGWDPEEVGALMFRYSLSAEPSEGEQIITGPGVSLLMPHTDAHADTEYFFQIRLLPAGQYHIATYDITEGVLSEAEDKEWRELMEAGFAPGRAIPIRGGTQAGPMTKAESRRLDELFKKSRSGREEGRRMYDKLAAGE